jgi:uncharacterized membrane protein
MEPQEFINRLERERIVSAVKAAEQRTSGEVRVFITQKPVTTPVIDAQKHFLAAGMDKTRDRNAVLIFVAPRTRQFAVVGDEAVHARCGDEFWVNLSNEMTAEFSKGNFTEAIVRGVERAGELLGKNFPRQSDDTNELSDEVLGD